MTSHYFIAIPVSNELKDVFAGWQEDLKENLTYKQWPHKEDLHITLKFLGAVEENTLEGLREALRSIEGHPSFSLQVGSIGTFGKHDMPRVLWAGVEKVNPLEALFKTVEEAALSVGFSKEDRAYRPHITLAKKWNGPSLSQGVLMDYKEKYSTERHSMNVEAFVLYQIFPSKSPKYEVVEKFNLKGGR